MSAEVTAAPGTSLSGRGDGGRHVDLRHPGGRLSDTRLGDGLDLKTSPGRQPGIRPTRRCATVGASRVGPPAPAFTSAG